MSKHNSYLFKTDSELERCYDEEYYSRNISDFNRLYNIGLSFTQIEKAWVNPKNSSWKSLERIMRRKRNTNETLNILFSGGSVLMGVGCMAKLNNGSSTYALNLAAWCSYPRRFIRALQEALDEITTSLQQRPIIISSRVCSGNGFSSAIGLQYMYAKKYSLGNNCGKWVDYSYPAAWNESQADTIYSDDTGWLPDLYIWDHSVNDDNDKKNSKQAPRNVIYDALIKHMLSLSNQPQVIVFDSITSKTHNNQIKKERLDINNKLLVPTIDYRYILRGHKESMSIWYATRAENCHPAWPTHVILAEVLFYSVLKPLLNVYIGSNENSLNDYVTAENNLNISEILYCHEGYSTYYDFTVDSSLVDGHADPVNVVGNWSVSHDELGRRGWLYLNNLNHHNSSNQSNVKKNSITFRCHNISRGYVSIDYYKSYTPNWGRAVVNITNSLVSVAYVEEVYEFSCLT